MDYCLYKFDFQTAVHFGINSLEKVNYTFSADTLFSALCIESMKMGEDYLEKLLTLVKSNRISFSDGFPYMNDKFFVPKPYLQIKSENDGNSTIKKAFKKLEYIAIEDFDTYLSGSYDVFKADDFDELGKYEVRVAASIRGEEETKPYRIGLFKFYENCGLYIIVGYSSEEDLFYVEELLEGLSYTGIGGERSSGYGKFLLKKKTIDEKLRNRIENRGEVNMLLSVALPKDSELDSALEEASVSVEKRSGFIESSKYADTQRRKKDLYMFKSGSCFVNLFEGDVYDVSNGQGNHPVYRYAKPMFMGVDYEK